MCEPVFELLINVKYIMDIWGQIETWEQHVKPQRNTVSSEFWAPVN